ncbi:homeobox protein 2-like [Oppia nitens]|uniref:homeobox protein 2-like n=1 Tax=Oppia nitens TaxID=1686743 RepID=UPI0023D9886F|nr:homeobox protein 2-like [Oppia nitens]
MSSSAAADVFPMKKKTMTTKTTTTITVAVESGEEDSVVDEVKDITEEQEEVVDDSDDGEDDGRYDDSIVDFTAADSKAVTVIEDLFVNNNNNTNDVNNKEEIIQQKMISTNRSSKSMTTTTTNNSLSADELYICHLVLVDQPFTDSDEFTDCGNQFVFKTLNKYITDSQITTTSSSSSPNKTSTPKKSTTTSTPTTNELSIDRPSDELLPGFGSALDDRRPIFSWHETRKKITEYKNSSNFGSEFFKRNKKFNNNNNNNKRDISKRQPFSGDLMMKTENKPFQHKSNQQSYGGQRFQMKNQSHHQQQQQQQRRPGRGGYHRNFRHQDMNSGPQSSSTSSASDRRLFDLNDNTDIRYRNHNSGDNSGQTAGGSGGGGSDRNPMTDGVMTSTSGQFAFGRRHSYTGQPHQNYF